MNGCHINTAQVYGQQDSSYVGDSTAFPTGPSSPYINLLIVPPFHTT